MVKHLHWVAGGALALACAREPPPPTEAQSAAPAVVQSAPRPKATSVPSPRPHVLRLRVVRFEADRAVLKADRELQLLGVNGSSLGWRPNDEVLVDGPTPDAEGQIDCTDASRCSLGLATGGDLALYDIDAHSAVKLLRGMSVNGVVVGPSRRASVEIRLANKDASVRALAAAFGLKTKRYRSVHLLAPPKLLDAARLAHVPTQSKPMDFELVGAPLSDVTRLMSQVSEHEMKGELTGQISISAREVALSDVLDAYFGLCGIEAKREGSAFVLTQTGNACSEHRVPERRCPQAQDQLRAVHVALRCIPVKELRVLAVGFPKRRSAIAVLGKGEPRGDEIGVRVGDFLGQSEVLRGAANDVEVNWMVAKIERDRVELELDDPRQEGVERRVTLKVP